LQTTGGGHKMNRIEREKALRRSIIIDAARQLFKMKNYYQTTIDDIVKLAQFGKGTFYKYFSNKDELLLVIYLDELSSLNKQIRLYVKSMEAELAVENNEIRASIESCINNIASILLDFYHIVGTFIFPLHSTMMQLNVDKKLQNANKAKNIENLIKKIVLESGERHEVICSIFELGIKHELMRKQSPQVMATIFDQMILGLSYSHNQAGNSIAKDEKLRDIIDIFNYGVVKL
jgi:AcrR family transcriptional regulator